MRLLELNEICPRFFSFYGLSGYIHLDKNDIVNGTVEQNYLMFPFYQNFSQDNKSSLYNIKFIISLHV